MWAKMLNIFAYFDLYFWEKQNLRREFVQSGSLYFSEIQTSKIQVTHNDESGTKQPILKTGQNRRLVKK